MTENELKDRLKRFLADSGVQMAHACRCIGRSRTLIYEWLRGDAKISVKTLALIESYLQKFNY